VLSGDAAKRDVTLIATGTEVQIAVAAAVKLAEGGAKAVVVSMPCTDLFDAQPAAYRAEVLGSAPRIGIEAASGFGWERWLGETGVFIGMQGFGASGPYEKLYEHFGITAAKVVEAAKALMRKA
jgi:transketolase